MNVIGNMQEVRFSITCYLLYSSINCNYYFGNKTVDFSKVRQILSVIHLQCIMVISKIKKFICYFRIKNLLLQG